MAKSKPTVAMTQERLSSYKFASTGYIVMDTGVRRDPASGRLIRRGEKSEVHKTNK